MEPILPRTIKGQFIAGFTYSPDTMFRLGQDAHNKGQKFPGTGNKASFRKGNMPHNTKNDQDITIRTNRNGNSYKFIRLELDKWEFLQKQNWMQVNGPIPNDKVLACKNGDTLNCEPNNWELITRAELIMRNRINRLKQEAICVCGVKFQLMHTHQKYCSPNCRTHSYQYTNEPIVYTPVNCLVCGNSFTPKHNKTVICSDECRRKRQIHYNQNHLSKQTDKPKQIREKVERPFLTTKVRICIICENAFFPQSNIQKTCSQSCQTINRSNIREAWKKVNLVTTLLPEKHCSKCAEKFAPIRNSHTVCSACKTKGPRQIKCIECGTEFNKEGWGVQLLCSDNCKRLRKNRLRGLYGYTRKPFPIIILKCRHCGGDFEARNGSFYCSIKCKHEVKLLKARNLRVHKAVVRLPKAKTQVTCICEHCKQEFKPVRKMKYCSDDCRKKVKRESANKYNRTNKKLPTTASRSVSKAARIRAPLPEQRSVSKANKRNPKAENNAAYAMLELNRNAPKHDREIINIKNIVSPDLSKMEFKAYDKRLRITRFFRSEERYLNFLKEQ